MPAAAFYQEGKGVDDPRWGGRGLPWHAGFKGMKMKIGRNPSTQTHLRHSGGACRAVRGRAPKRDIARGSSGCAALSGPQVKLMVDVNLRVEVQRWAIRMGRATRALRSLLDRGTGREPTTSTASARVAAALATPIAGYETEVGLYGFFAS